MHNTNKYTKLYSGETPMFLEDNIFEIIIPMSKVASLQIGPERNSKENSKENNKEINGKIIDILLSKPELSVKEIASILNTTTGKNMILY